MVLYTERLILRPWLMSDATNLYHYAKDERIGPMPVGRLITALKKALKLFNPFLCVMVYLPLH